MKIKQRLSIVKEVMCESDMPATSSVLDDAISLIERLETKIINLEHRRKCNADQVKKLTKKLRQANKGLRSLGFKASNPNLSEAVLKAMKNIPEKAKSDRQALTKQIIEEVYRSHDPWKGQDLQIYNSDNGCI